MSEDENQQNESEDEVDKKLREFHEGQKKKDVVTINVVNRSAEAQQEIWNELTSNIKKGYEDLGIPFDVTSVESKKDVEHHMEVLQQLKEKSRKEAEAKGELQKPSGSTYPLTAQQTGSSKYIDKSVDIANREYSSYQEMMEDIEEEAKDTSSKHQNEAKEYLDALAQKFQRTPQTVEFHGSLVKALQKRQFPKDSEEGKLMEEMRKIERSKWKRR
jgi:hypothetical protein